MKDSTKKIIKIAAVVLAFALIISSVFIIRSCSAPPDYEEIRPRVEELIKASFDVNDVVWGNGLPTYERVTKPIWLNYESGKTYVDEDGKEQPLNYHYYYLETSGIRLLAFRNQKATKENFRYAFVTSQPINPSTLPALFPLAEGEVAFEGVYTEIYADSAKNIYAYLIPYTEKIYDFYYIDGDPADYDFVVDGTKYASVNEIRDFVRTVYSDDYAESLNAILFDGVTIAEGSLVDKARYTTISTSRGFLFASLNTFEPLFIERRVYLYDSAKIDRANSNSSTVVVEFSTYLPSTPDKIVPAKLTFVFQDSTWYLASPTY